MAEHCSETESQILGLQSNEDEIHEEGQSSGTHCGGQRYPLCCLANEDPWTCGFKKAIPGVHDMLAAVIQQDVHRECFHVIWMDQDVVGEQSKFFHSTKRR